MRVETGVSKRCRLVPLAVGAVLVASTTSAWAQSASPIFDSHPKPKYEREPYEGAVRAGVATGGAEVDTGFLLGLGGYARLVEGFAFGPVVELVRFSGSSASSDGTMHTVAVNYRYLGIAGRLYPLDDTPFDPYLELLPLGFVLGSGDCGNGGPAVGMGAGLNGYAATWLRLGLGARAVGRLPRACGGEASWSTSRGSSPNVGGAASVVFEATFATHK